MSENGTDYGVDGPLWIWGLSAAGVLTAVLAPRVLPLWAALAASGVLLGYAGSLYFYSRFGKLRAREALLDLAEIRESDRVLDVGVGRGLLAVGAARRARAGRVLGIDVWTSSDLSGNGKENAIANAIAEGVSDRLELQNVDARRTGELRKGFDAVVSLMCLHNIGSRRGREEALEGIFQALAPGGRFVIGDWIHTSDYERKLRDLGAENVERSILWRPYAPPFSVVAVRGRRPFKDSG